MVAAHTEHYRTLLRREMSMLATRYGVTSLGLFGSLVRNENRPNSDLDILVSFVDPSGLFGFL